MDVPDWYRKLIEPEPKLRDDKWRTDPEDPRYLRQASCTASLRSR